LKEKKHKTNKKRGKTTEYAEYADKRQYPHRKQPPIDAGAQ
jgi:hypothetical protein